MAVNLKFAHLYAYELAREREQREPGFEPHLRRAFAKANDPKKLAHFLADPSQKRYIVNPHKNGLLARITDGTWPSIAFSTDDLEKARVIRNFAKTSKIWAYTLPG